MPLDYGPPDRKLARELRQVADAARDAQATLADWNAVPEDFPRSALNDLCTALRALPEGTAENARPSLELARNALPKLRREHFDIEAEEEAPPGGPDAPPRLTRGMVLDQKLLILFAAVSTALDEYRAQAGVQPDDGVRPEDVAVSTSAARDGGIEARTEEVVGGLRDSVAQLDTRGVSATEPGDLLRRRLRDGENLALAARSQLRQRTTVARWFDNVVSAFRRAPDLIEGAGKALQTVGHAGEPYVQWLADFLVEELRTRLTQMRSLGEAMAESARRLRSGPPRPPVTTELDPADLAAMARAGLPVSDDPDVPGGLSVEATSAFAPGSFERVSAAWARCAARVTRLNLRGSRLPGAEPLAGLTALRSLDLAATQVADLEPLRGLTALQSLDLAHTRVVNLEPLRGLTALHSLDLAHTRVVNLEPLRGLTALQSLDLSDTRVTDLGPLKDLTALQILSLWDTQVTDLEPLGGLAALQSLSVAYTQVVNLEPLKGLTALESLDLEFTQVVNLEPLRSLTALKSLDLSDMQVTNLDPIAALPALSELRVNLDDSAQDAFDADRLRRGLRPLFTR